MVDPVLGGKLRKKWCVNISRENTWEKLRADRKERILGRKNNNSGSLEFNNTDGNNNNCDSKLMNEIAILSVSKKVNVPLISTSSKISMCHIDNRYFSIADWIGFKRIIWERLPSRYPLSVSS